MAIETSHYFASGADVPAPQTATSRERAGVRADDRADGQLGLRRVCADGNACVAGGVDGRTIAAALRESGFSRRGFLPLERKHETGTRGRRYADFFCFGRPRDRILLGMSPLVDAKALRTAIKDGSFAPVTISTARMTT